MHFLHSSVSELSLAIKVHRCNIAVVNSTYRCFIMQLLFIDVFRLRKQALTSLKIILKPGKQHLFNMPDQWVSSGVPGITAN